MRINTVEDIGIHAGAGVQPGGRRQKRLAPLRTCVCAARRGIVARGAGHFGPPRSGVQLCIRARQRREFDVD